MSTTVEYLGILTKLGDLFEGVQINLSLPSRLFSFRLLVHALFFVENLNDPDHQ